MLSIPSFTLAHQDVIFKILSTILEVGDTEAQRKLTRYKHLRLMYDSNLLSLSINITLSKVEKDPKTVVISMSRTLKTDILKVVR